jgi:Putative amidoligase enzyme
MALPWTFGVELEFACAFMYPLSVSLPDETEIRKLRFKPYRHEIDQLIEVDDLPPIESSEQLADRTIYNRNFIKELVTLAVQRDIAQTFSKAGLQVNLADPSLESVLNWKIDTDGSVQGPYNTEYMWSSIEIISPPLQYTPENLRAVEKVCNLVANTYLTDINFTAGLHVHVSAGIQKTFRLETLQNLFRLLIRLRTAA